MKRRFALILRISWVVLGLLAVTALAWWSATADQRAIRALPEAQRLPLLQSTLANLKNVCDPAPPLSMREFCRRQAELAVKFSECARDPACQQLARRHLYQPHRCSPLRRTGASRTEGADCTAGGRAARQATKGHRDAARGTSDAQPLERHARRALVSASEFARIEVLTMKDALFLAVTAAFFVVAFLYAKSFDQL